MPYERKSVHTIQDVLQHVPSLDAPKRDKIKHDFQGDLIKMASDRYIVFSQSLICPCCGLHASFFAKERHINFKTKQPLSESYHFNLYGINSEGQEVMFTKDHIIPKAKGGLNSISNYQTMCKVCNELKKDTLPEDFNLSTSLT